MPYQPILEDPTQIASLNGQRFVVLRAPAAVAVPSMLLQQGLRRELTGDVFYPASAHLTLTGLVTGTSCDALATVVEAWAGTTPALRFEAEDLDTFPPPAQVACIRVRRTLELAAALGSLRDHAAVAGLTVSSSAPLDEWVPRMSLVYGSRLESEAWHEVRDTTLARLWQPVGGDVRFVEVLAFDEGREHTGGSFPLGTTRQAR